MKKTKAVFYDLGFSAHESATLVLKSELYRKLLDTIEKQNKKPRDLEKILDVPQPRVSELLRGKISTLSIEKLIIYLEKLGIVASLTFKTKKAS